ncbi:hypothetical protein LCGC14_0595920 [marine sediment metagenome]|uniref:Uncharacterized protein n=1 Tax=marine sediment metagenome TaxID=412755 RepID=A0A0F9UKH3_9ZZZZ|nr:hypothetical protein [bacterium]
MTRNKRRKICPICGVEKTHIFIPLCGECYPPMYKKGSFPHQKLRRRKIWKEKRLKKFNETGNKCECCEKPKEYFGKEL